MRLFSPAKINLTLHITGKRDDGFHLLDSLVTFTDFGDELTFTPQNGFRFTVSGPFATAFAPQDVLVDGNSGNLIVRAAHKLAAATGHPLDVAIHLTKNLPLGSGIGGGSSNAATTLAGLAALWGLDNTPLLTTLARELGSDVPVCLPPHHAVQMQGVGDVLVPLAAKLPRLHLLLANPNIPCPTPAVYRGMAMNDYATPMVLPVFKTTHDFVDFLIQKTRNDMTGAATRIVPQIADVLKALNHTEGCLLARMSGSGSTCFGIFADGDSAHAAATQLRARHPD